MFNLKMALRGIMKNSTILYKQIRIAKFNINQALAIVRHDILLQSEEKLKQNRITSKSHLNSYLFRGKIIKSKNERENILKYIKSLFINENEKFNNIKFSKTKSKIRKWLNSENTEIAEKKLFEKIIFITEKCPDRKVDKNAIIENYRNSGIKFKKFNDKIKAINDICDLHNEKTNLNVDSGSQFSTRLVSVLLKIPEHNQVELEAEKQQEILIEYFSSHFPNYEVILSSIHKDEATRDHVHLIIDAKNKNTGAFDFVETQYRHVIESLELDDLPPRYSMCNEKQVRLIGELLQDHFYDFINKKMKPERISFIKKQYTNIYEKEIERERIKNDTGKRIADREYNTANYLSIVKNKLRNENQVLTRRNEKIRKKLDNFIRETLKAATLYSATSLQSFLKKYAFYYQKTLETDITSAEKTKLIAVKLQNSSSKKSEILKISKKKIKK